MTREAWSCHSRLENVPCMWSWLKRTLLIGENSLHFIFQNELHFLLTKNDFAGLAKVIERENVFENRPGISGRFENVFFGEGMFFP